MASEQSRLQALQGAAGLSEMHPDCDSVVGIWFDDRRLRWSYSLHRPHTQKVRNVRESGQAPPRRSANALVSRRYV